MKIQKRCENCHNQYSYCKRSGECGNDCPDFLLMYEIERIAEKSNTEIELIAPQEDVEQTNTNQFLYKSDVEDWADHHKTIWRLSLKLEPEEWKAVASFFKYYKNRNLVGWGTTSPVEVTEILTGLKGDAETKDKLDFINAKIKALELSLRMGYERDVFGVMDRGRDERKVQALSESKRNLLGVVF